MRRRKVALHTSSHFMPMEVWRRAVSTTSECRIVTIELRLENWTKVLEVCWTWRVCDARLRGIVLHTCYDLLKPAQTCPSMFIIQWPLAPVARCQFLHFRRLLIFSRTSYPAEIAYLTCLIESFLTGVRLVELHWNRNVDPSRSPCWKIVHGKRFEQRNFSVLCPVLLKLYISA